MKWDTSEFGVDIVICEMGRILYEGMAAEELTSQEDNTIDVSLTKVNHYTSCVEYRTNFIILYLQLFH